MKTAQFRTTDENAQFMREFDSIIILLVLISSSAERKLSSEITKVLVFQIGIKNFRLYFLALAAISSTRHFIRWPSGK